MNGCMITGPVDCYHPTGAAGAAYMASTAGGAQSSGQASLRVQPTPQPSAPPAPQQDMKTTMVCSKMSSNNSLCYAQFTTESHTSMYANVSNFCN